MIQLKSLKEITLNPNNPRIFTEGSIEKMVKSEKSLPTGLWLNPVKIDAQGNILAGNLRTTGATIIFALKRQEREQLLSDFTQKIENSNNSELDKEEAIEQARTFFIDKKVPCVYANTLTPEQEAEFLVKDNLSYGLWDMDELTANFGVDKIEEWGMDLEEMKAFKEYNDDEAEQSDNSKSTPNVEEDDFEPPVIETMKTDIIVGDLFEIGVHRLLCADSFDSNIVKSFIGIVNDAVCVTDPPYGIGLKYVGVMANNTSGEILNDNVEFDPTCIFVLGEIKYYIFGADYFIEKLPNRKGLCIWAKAHTEQENLVFGAAFESFWRSHKNKREVWYEKRIGNLAENLHKHASQKPISLIARCINDSDTKGEVLDLFLGSGSTMVAAHQLNRKCYGVELSPDYCQVIVDRMRKLDPTLIIKKNGVVI